MKHIKTIPKLSMSNGYKISKKKNKCTKKTCKQISLFGMFPFYIKRMRQKIVLAAKH